MNRAVRTLAAVACGFAAGLVIGPVSLLTAAASDAWVRGWSWPEMDRSYALSLLGTSVPAGINGAIGAGLAGAVGTRRRLGITVLPAAIHVVAALFALVASPREFLLLQLFALMFSVVIWPTGRLGQMIGWALRGRTPAPTPPAQAPP